MRPGFLLGLVFIALALAVALLAGFLGWKLFAVADPATHRMIADYAALGFAGLALAIVIAWAALHAGLVRPIQTITREIETLVHTRKARPLELPEGHATAALAKAVQGLLERLALARAETAHEIETASQLTETYRRRLETILLDMSEGVIVCNLDNRVLLYNEAAALILNRPEALGLGRRIFALFEREAIEQAVSELSRQQRADTTRKLRIRRKVDCRLREDGGIIDARLALICSSEVETEGYVLTFNEGAGPLTEPAALPPRPEFYDFDLFRQPPGRELAETPLRELRSVVFDTETTGLAPSKGDEIISIGAVRLVNARIVSGESFDQLVNPGRKIPSSSIRFHGITDADVKDAPDAARVLPRFRNFCGRSVLIAHNAAFDMKFLELKQTVSGVTFDNTVLDVLLLSAFLHDHIREHSLDATAVRLGVEISGRHSALGDAMTTARIFLAMLDPLYQRGVTTLGDALDVSGKMTSLRRQQAEF